MEQFKKAECQRVGLKAYAVNKETIDMYHRMGFIDVDVYMTKQFDWIISFTTWESFLQKYWLPPTLFSNCLAALQ